MKNLLVAQSGGPTAAINATLAGVLQVAYLSKKVDKVYGAKNGIEGAINNRLLDLSSIVKDMNVINNLMHTPSSALGTCRYKMKDWRHDDTDYKKIIETFLRHDIKYFIYIGGNDSMDTVDKLSQYCRMNHYDIMIMGAPKTIDNDLNKTDHCPGYGSALKYIATTFSELAFDIGSYDIPAVTIVEVMGRNAGWLTAGAALSRGNGSAGVDLIYLCERVFDPMQFIEDVRNKLKEKKGILVAISEGIQDNKGNYISSQQFSGETDDFGHQYIAGAARALEQLVRKEIGCKVRSIELNLMQRCAAHLASTTDVTEAMMLGQKAFTCALEGETGRMAAILRLGDAPYQVDYISVPVNEVANQEKKVPLDWITPEGNDITNELLTYMRPLIQGETNLLYENGLPVFVSLR